MTHPAPRDLDALAALVAAGDDDAFGEWYEAERTPVYRLCLGFLANLHDAEDVTQEALMRLHDRLPEREPDRPYQPWRNTVVLNLCRDRIRGEQRRRDREKLRLDPPTGVLPDPADEAEASECAGALAGALRSLPPREREVFVLIDLDRRPTSEVASCIGISASTVRAALAMARTRLEEAVGAVLPRRYAGGSR